MTKEMYEEFKKYKCGDWVYYSIYDISNGWIVKTNRIDDIDLSYKENQCDMRVGGIWIGMEKIIGMCND